MIHSFSQSGYRKIGINIIWWVKKYPKFKPSWLVNVLLLEICNSICCERLGNEVSEDLTDRLMRHSIDSFGSNGFPRSKLAEALNASFTATSYVGLEPSSHARDLLRQYLEAVLGLADLEGGASLGWPTEMNNEALWRQQQQQQQHSPKTADTFHLTAFEEASQQQYNHQHHHIKAESTPMVIEYQQNEHSG
jgi:hypothetical protein